MKALTSYSAAAFQTVPRRVLERHQLDRNLKRAMELIEISETSSFAKGSSEVTTYAPVKLMVFPEFFLQGWTAKADLNKYKEDILIQIPGEETDRLGEAAARAESYVCGAALEYDPDWPDRFLSCGFILSPEGKLIHKYHKFNCFMEADCDTAPHDMFDMYVAKYGKGKSVLETFFPVVDTAVGKLGTYICFDSVFPETTRALALNGAEVLVYMTGWGSTRQEHLELMCRMRAIENLAYVVAGNNGGYVDADGVSGTDDLPETWWAGDSMIVDNEGVVLSRTHRAGEAVCVAVIHLEELRRRRSFYSRNTLAMLRTEVWREMYKNPIYPVNQFLERPIQSVKDLERRIPTQVMENFYARGIFTRPKDSRET